MLRHSRRAKNEKLSMQIYFRLIYVYMPSNVCNFSLNVTMQYKSLILLAIITSNGLCTINTYEMVGEIMNMRSREQYLYIHSYILLSKIMTPQYLVIGFGIIGYVLLHEIVESKNNWKFVLLHAIMILVH